MYKNILLSVDTCDESTWRRALPTAVEYCRAFGAKLHVVTVVPDVGSGAVNQFFPQDFEQRLLEETGGQLKRLLSEQLPTDLEAEPITSYGTVYHEIITTAERVGADLIIMASHRPTLRDYLIGPNAIRVVRHFDGSVLVVRD